MLILQATQEEADYIDNSIVRFNQKEVPFTQNETPVFKNYVIKAEGQIIAGVNSFIYHWGILYIDVLFVDERYRGKNLGTRLLQQVENEAMKMGVHLSHLDTFDFQAKDFYLKQGYEIFGVLDDCPKGHKRFYFKKVLAAHNRIQVRRYQDEDAEFISKIYYHTIHTINAKDYTKEQVDAWAPWSSVQDYSGWKQKLEKIKPYVALINDTIVGFAEFEANGHIDCFYVHHEFQGCGVGSALMAEIEQEVMSKSLSRIYAEVSITAKPFFEQKGFKVVTQQSVTIRGVKLTNYIMEKYYS
jgi:GNAT superfamily N-acetyltransferase